MGKEQRESTPPIQNEKPIGHIVGLSRFTRELFPRTRRSEIPMLISNVVGSLKPFCTDDPLNENKKDVWAIIRGSSIKRLKFKTPFAFWEISRFFQNHDLVNTLLEPDDKLGKIVSETLALGPNDLDVRYKLQKGESPLEVRNTLQKSFIEQGFQYSFKDAKHMFEKNIGKDIYQGEIEEIVIGGETANARTFYSILFYMNGQFKIKLDLGELAENEQVYDDLRFTGMMPGCELDVGEIVTSNGKPHVRFYEEAWSKRDSPQMVTIMDRTRLPHFLYGMLRNISFLTFYPRPNRHNMSLAKGEHQLYTAGLLTDQWKLPLKLFDPQMDMPVLEKRASDFTGLSLLHLIYDPFTPMDYYFICDLFPFTRLGKILVDPSNFEDVHTSMFFSLDPKHGYTNDTRLYHRKVLKNPGATLLDTGPFMLIRALKACGFIPQNAPETLSYAASLFTPVIPLRQNEI